MDGEATRAKPKKPYVKPAWQKKAMFEKFALNCLKARSACGQHKKFT